MRQNLRFFLWAGLAGLALRLIFFFWTPQVTSDSLFYADIAKNWLQHGTYALTDNGQVRPTFARLPGYPALLALFFAIFGADTFKPVLLSQIAADLLTCFIIADIARRTISDRAAKAAFLLAALCPFFANYAAAALTETLEILFTSWALDYAVIGLDSLEASQLTPWVGCGSLVLLCTLLRPDGGLLLLALGVYLGLVLLGRVRAGKTAIPVVRAGLMVAVFALAPLGLWGLRNWHTLHHVQFLAPRYANQEGEFVPMGFNHWVKTWIADYVSTEEIYWNVPGDTVDPEKLPARAFDSPAQKERVLDIFDQYNKELHITPEIDAQFEALAAERIRAHPLRYYVSLPVVRIADMWLRPRTELLPSDTRWYEFNDDPRWLALAILLGIINLLYVAAAALGVLRRWDSIAWVGLALTFLLLRSAFLGTMENPEARYTLECYPVVIWLASALWSGIRKPHPTAPH